MDKVENHPIIVEGRTVGRAIIVHNRSQAIKAAEDAASHISTPDNIQICAFTDGSHSRDNRGGVGLVYRWQWLPREWAAESAAADPCGDFVEQAWPFGHAVGILVMEGVGVLEALHAANEELKRHLPVLKTYASPINVNLTTDCQPIIEHIVRTAPAAERSRKTLPLQLIKQIRDLFLALQNHGLEVTVELRWCPRNMVPQLTTADELAGEAMRSGLGSCNITRISWSKATKSVIMKELVPMLSGAVRFTRVTAIHRMPRAGSKDKTGKKMKRVRRREKRAKRAANASTQPTTTAETHPQLPLPDLPLPLKPVITNTESTTASRKPMPAPQVESDFHKKLAASGAGKRGAEGEEQNNSEEKPTKKAKASPVRETKTDTTERTASSEPPPKQYIPQMPTAWTLDPATITITSGPGQEVVTISAIWAAPNIRKETASTMETGEKLVFINDGVSGFSVVMPIPRKSTGW
ncbi:hypothetical protein J7T55_005611 [Diaporthe amygdali]|uniref:uncharacterized protein n=1 Tax=Phomopsis amygdali TaxID=1214568 RepID=UPI0022FEC877|nr:uncharacterized protein J7T55_005611 [Diaporthe amygdali]KAJ0124273.1 hypothetical protein J7T55_005611 [Diaporthe amygdali]